MLQHEPIYDWKNYHPAGFGDVWAGTCCLLTESERLGRPIRVKTTGNVSSNVRMSRRELSKQIVEVIDTTGELCFVDYDATRKIEDTDCGAYGKLLPTKKRWKPEGNVIAYQFDGVYHREFKNMPENVADRFLEKLVAKGYEPVNIGGGKAVLEIVDTLAKCQMFVGAASGMTIASISVGTPIYVIAWKLPNWAPKWYNKCQYQLRKDVKWYRRPETFLASLRV